MITKDDINKIANLARIGITDEENEALLKDISNILKYIDQIKNAKIDLRAESRVGAVKNVFREDVAKNFTGANTETLLNEAPEREGDSLKVKKILMSSDL